MYFASAEILNFISPLSSFNFHLSSFLLNSPCLPLWFDGDKELVVSAGHGAREHRDILLVEEVIHLHLERAVGPSKAKESLQMHIIHIIGYKNSRQRAVVARHGETLRVVRPTIAHTPTAPA